MQAEENTQVVILTKNFRIEGKISLYSGSRLTDYMNQAEQFIAVTNARVIDHGGKELTTGSFLNINVKSIEVILPGDEAA